MNGFNGGSEQAPNALIHRDASMMIPIEQTAPFLRELLGLPDTPMQIGKGEGCWSTIYDLGDGTVAKVVRNWEGFGDGTPYYRREAAVLETLGSIELPLRIPRLHAAISSEDLASRGIIGILRIDRIPGSSWKAPWTPGAFEDLAGFLTTFHRLPRRLLEHVRPPMSRSREEARRALEIAPDPQDVVLAKKLIALLDDVPDAHLAPVHSDIHPLNILAENGRLTGVIDFATTGVDLPEFDFAHIVMMPDLYEAAVRAYREREPERLHREYLALCGAIFMLSCCGAERKMGHPEEEAVRRAGLARCTRVLREIGWL